jgi:hypothetical protein
MLHLVRFFILAFFCHSAVSQEPQAPRSVKSHAIEQTERHGTCATTESTASQMAFVIDSKITLLSEGKFIGFQEGCKVALVRPTILIAATGLEDDIY